MHTTKSENEQGSNVNNCNCNSKVTSHSAEPQLTPLLELLLHLSSQLLKNPLELKALKVPLKRDLRLFPGRTKQPRGFEGILRALIVRWLCKTVYPICMRPIALQTPVPYGRKAYAENIQGHYIWQPKLIIKAGPHL